MACHTNSLMLGVVVFMMSFSCVTLQLITTGKRRVTIPPLIVKQPEKAVAFKIGEALELPCVASGKPDPIYRWEMDGKKFEPSGNDGRIAIQPGVGTLIFANPIAKDEATYQCFADNGHGIAITVKVYLRPAMLGNFVSKYPRTHRPQLGDSIVLPCTPPVSYPPAVIHWKLIKPGERTKAIALTDRISMDPDGNLHFANVIPDDRQDGRRYVCTVFNSIVRRASQGEYQSIHPQGEVMDKVPPQIQYQSQTNHITLRGDTLRIKCIFSGSPTPRVSWFRAGAPMPVRKREESFGQELVIEDVQLKDAGKYQCQGLNEEFNVPLRLSYNVRVQSAPYWIRELQTVDAKEGDAVEFHCHGSGIPEPTHHWFINGVPLEKAKVSEDVQKRRTKINYMLRIENVTKTDGMVIQCNVTNKHGYIFKNAYLNVLTEPATIVERPDKALKVAEGKNILLRCAVFGSPKPLVVWKKGSEQLTGGRFKVTPEGHLSIEDVSLVDAGVYTCSASNNIGMGDSATGRLIVRRKTRIMTAPMDVMVREHTEAKFTCTATTDPEEIQNLQILWKKDDQIIDYDVAQRAFKNYMDNSLTISGTISWDTGKYTCVATNGLDEDEAGAQLVVQAEPDPPRNVRAMCYDQKFLSTIEWQPGRENYAPILNYIIQFNTSFAEDSWIVLTNNISQNVRQKNVTISPYGNYTFRVLARNKIGLSQPSHRTLNVCKPFERVPEKNPENVIGEGDEPDNLIIYWTPMPRIEHNGRNFMYVITYKRIDISNAKEYSVTIDKPDQFHYVVPRRVPSYVPFNITIKSKNRKGDAVETPQTVVGWSGENVPEQSPKGLMADTATIKGQSVTLQWRVVDESPEAVRGFFRGYRIQFYRTEEGPESMRDVDYIVNAVKQYPRPRSKRQTVEYVTYNLKNLPSYSEVGIQVRILNKYYVGPPSEMIYITTKEAEPGPPHMFEVVARGATHFELQWTPPREPNGIIQGYQISYQSIVGLNLGRLQYRQAIKNPEAIRARLTGLSPKTDYRVFLSAVTQVGQGEPIFLDAMTTVAGIPSAPTFDIIDIGDTTVTVIWEPSRSGNPGSVFFIQYRPRGMYQWEESPNEVLDYQMTVKHLDPGTTYQLRVMSRNGAGEQAPAEWQEFHTGGTGPGRVKLSTAVWFYCIFLVLLIIIVLCGLFVWVKKVRDTYWEKKEALIEEQVRHLQAEEFARQLGGVLNQYAVTGSQEVLDTSHASYPTSDFSKPSHLRQTDESSGDEYEDGPPSGHHGYHQQASQQSYDQPYSQSRGNPAYSGEQHYQPQGYQPQGYQPDYAEPPDYTVIMQGEKANTSSFV